MKTDGWGSLSYHYSDHEKTITLLITHRKVKKQHKTLCPAEGTSGDARTQEVATEYQALSSLWITPVTAGVTKSESMGEEDPEYQHLWAKQPAKLH